MSDFLKIMARTSADRAAAAQGSLRSADLDRPLVSLALDSFDVIAELKNRSPSEGALAGGPSDRDEQASRYVAGGAAAISVLTEPTQFAGDLAHLDQVVKTIADSPVPVMRKDFLVDPIQVLESRAAGASGVLLIARMLSDGQFRDLLNCAIEHAMFVLLESFDENDLKRASKLLDTPRYGEYAASGQLLFGVNTRDLQTLHVEPERLKTLGPLLPQGVACVAESGLHDGQDAAAAADWGYSLVLVGTALMRAADPERVIQEMLAAGRAKRAA
jgi:indole-3-glycerol phosphate synthase